jgi:hypothetical protein
VNALRLIDSLERFAGILPATVRDVAGDDARWRPPEGTWSILEIVTHLADEEVEDFRTRVELTLRDPTAPWPPIDPVGWAIERRYNEGDPAEALARFISERRASLEWLRTLNGPDWSTTYHHPKAGPIRAGDLLAAWSAHDALHLRQIAKRMFQLARRDGGEYTTNYAGEWTA